MPAEPERVIERTVEKRGGFVPALIGGIVAAVLGFAAAKTQVIDPLLPPGLRAADNGAVIEALTAQIDSQSKSLAELRATVAGIELPDVTGIRQQVEQLSGKVAPLGDEIAALKGQVGDLDQLGDRLTAVEKRPISEGASPEAIAAYERELTKLQETIATQRTEVEGLIDQARAMEAEARVLEEKAAADAQLSANRAAAARLRSQLDTGASFGGLVAELTAGGVAVPDTLTAPAAEGVVTVATLREGFPPAAREALAAARKTDAGGTEGISAFFQRQLGARSVEPREGADPDAVLSRAEAALVAGDLSKTLDEIAALPEPAQAALADWVSVARTRQAAIAAADALAQSLNSN